MRGAAKVLIIGGLLFPPSPVAHTMCKYFQTLSKIRDENSHRKEKRDPGQDGQRTPFAGRSEWAGRRKITLSFSRSQLRIPRE